MYKNESESLYAFRRALLQVHKPGRLRQAVLKDFRGTRVTDAWSIACPKDAGVVLRHAAEDLKEYFAVSMGVDIPVVSDPGPYAHSIRLAVDAALAPRTFRILVREDVAVAGADERAAAQGCYALEDEMNLNEVPGLAPGEIVRTARFSPRMVHSGLGPDLYPDEHLRAIAHAGMDAIVVGTGRALASPDACHAVNDVIRRAGSFGIDVYTFSSFKNERHPSDPDAWAHYDAMHGSLFERCPDLKGIIFVGESCEFPSHDPRTTGRDYHASKGDAKPSPGWFPCDDYPEFISLLRDVIHSHSPGAEILFWSYNWGFLDAGPRLKLIERLPTDVVLMATFEMFENFDVAPGVSETCTDYTLWSIGPGPYFASESEAARKRGMKMYAMTNTCGNTWDIGVVPYLPAPQAWLKRFRAVVQAKENWRLDGLMESHTYGFWPSMMPELAKQAFFSPAPDMEQHLARIVARDFGAENVGVVLKALQCFSDGMAHCVSTNQEQYGPCRIGPAYPLFFERTEPLPIGPQSIRNPNSTCLPVYRYSHEQAVKLLWETEEYAKMTVCFQEGCDMLEPVVKSLDADRRAAAEELLDVARFIENTARSTVHVKRWHALKWKLGISLDADPIWVGGRRGMPDAIPVVAPEKSVEDEDAVLAELVAIAEAEIRNAEATIMLVERHSRLGYTQELDYCTSPEQLRWKIAVVRRAVAEEILPRMQERRMSPGRANAKGAVRRTCGRP